MNTRLVNSAAGVINAALAQCRTAAGIALALESAQMLMTPEIAAELERFRAMELGDIEGRVSAACAEPGHSTWLRAVSGNRGCPWCRVAELEALTPAAIQTCRVCGAGYSYGEPCQTCEFKARMAAELAVRGLEDPHDSPLHHSYKTPRDLPELGGQR